MQTYFPFDSGQGANVTENMWTKMAQHWLLTGVIRDVLNNFQVYEDSTGMQVKVKSGAAWIKGHYFESDAEEIMPISASDSTNPRIDRIIIRLDWTENTISLAVLQGVPAVSPVAPSLTQNSSRWEIALAQVRVNAGVSTIIPGNSSDERVFVKAFDVADITPTFTDLTLLNGAQIATGRKPEIEKVGYTITLTGGIKNITSGTIVGQLPVGSRPDKALKFVGAADTTSPGNFCTWEISSTGNIKLLNSTSGIVDLSFDGITFTAKL